MTKEMVKTVFSLARCMVHCWLCFYET